MSVLSTLQSNVKLKKEEVFSLEEYLNEAKHNSKLYEGAAERLLRSIGKPKLIETIKDPVLSRVFQNRVIKTYSVFNEFFGMEETIENIVSFLVRSAQGLEEARQILYLSGPVGGGKSTIAETLKKLLEQQPIYVLAVHEEQITSSGPIINLVKSPIFESPLGLFLKIDSDKLNIPERYLTERLSSWANKRLIEFNGDISKFNVVKIYPSQINQVAIATVEPGDENNQDISALVGKIDIRKLGRFSQQDPDAYNFSGGLCIANQGLLDFPEMFKAPPKVLYPLLNATQSGIYNGTEAIGSIPFNGLILAHSNEAEWQTFKSDPINGAIIDRITLIRVPYCLRMSQEKKIYEKLIKNSALKDATCAPETLKLLAEFSVLTRLFEKEKSNIYSKARVYDGENMKEKDVKASSLQTYKDEAGITEGFTGFSTRDAFKVLSRTFNYDSEEISANPVHLLHVLEQELVNAQLSDSVYNRYRGFIHDHLVLTLLKQIEKEFQQASLEQYDSYGQTIFENYFIWADCWCQDSDYRDADTGEMFNREILDSKLSEIEKAAGIANPKDFRSEVVSFVLRAKAHNKGKLPDWKSYRKLKDVIEKKMFTSTEVLLPLLSFGTQANKDDQKKHEGFVQRMIEKGYTARMVKVMATWYLAMKKS